MLHVGEKNWTKVVWLTCSSLEGVLVATGSNTKSSSVSAVAQPAPAWTLYCNCSSRHLLLHLLEWAKVPLNGLHQLPYRKWHIQFILEAFIKCWGGPSLHVTLLLGSLPWGSPPPFGERFVQKMVWLMWPPPLNFRAGWRPTCTVTSPKKIK